MSNNQQVHMLYGREGLTVRVPASAAVLRGAHPPALARPGETIHNVLRRPIGCAALAELVTKKKPKTVAITISDITRPVPNKVILPALLEVLNQQGVSDK